MKYVVTGQQWKRYPFLRFHAKLSGLILLLTATLGQQEHKGNSLLHYYGDSPQYDLLC